MFCFSINQEPPVSVLFHSSQVWGVKEGPYEFKPAPASSSNDMFSPLNFAPPLPMEKRIDGSFVLQEWWLLYNHDM